MKKKMHTWITTNRSGRITAIFTLAAATLVLFSYDNGPAQHNTLVTGAPFNSSQNCSKCHKGGSFGGAISLRLLDATTNAAVTSYKPGKKYKFEIALSKTSSGNVKYGFQTVCVNSANANVSKWGAVPANTHKIRKSTRDYVEHSTPLTSGTITIPWTGPVAGTGSVTFYTGGNIVDGNNLTSGDQPVNTSLTISESPAPAAFADNSNNGKAAVKYSLAPLTRTGEKSVLFTNGGVQQRAQVIFTDMQGNVLYTNSTVMNEGDNLVPIPDNGKVKGLVVITVITQDGVKTSLKLGLNQ